MVKFKRLWNSCCCRPIDRNAGAALILALQANPGMHSSSFHSPPPLLLPLLLLLLLYTSDQ
jgi:hypothetical protein